MNLFRFFSKREAKTEKTQEPTSSFPPEPDTEETAAVYAEMKNKLSQISMNLLVTDTRATQIEEAAKGGSTLRPPASELEHA